MTTPNSQVGLTMFCPTCMAVRGQRCQSGSGRTLKVTHDSRFRAELNAEPIRAWFREQMTRVTA